MDESGIIALAMSREDGIDSGEYSLVNRGFERLEDQFCQVFRIQWCLSQFL